ncbi:YggT family protein [Rothia aerolata]|uniref:YggT family protein n=1 Tax=Rothia aerolata TaxID=1812262 RepID=A0A917IMT9_9MICC|nr:YggT family protein [Rothia aerolata]GGH56515.1 YggT family protein [Rothia aerolata]
MGFLFAALTIAVYLFYFALILRLIFDWIQMFARYWRPKGIVLVVASAVNAVTDPPMNFLRRVVPPLRIGGMALDLGFLILVVVVGFVYSILANITAGMS